MSGYAPFMDFERHHMAGPGSPGPAWTTRRPWLARVPWPAAGSGRVRGGDRKPAVRAVLDALAAQAAEAS